MRNDTSSSMNVRSLTQDMRYGVQEEKEENAQVIRALRKETEEREAAILVERQHREALAQKLEETEVRS